MQKRLISILLLLLVGNDIAAQQGGRSFETIVVGGAFTYSVSPGDTVSAIAARFGVAAAEVIESNGLSKPYRLAVGQSLTIDNTHLAAIDPSVAITVNIPQRMLFIAADGRVDSYPITVGRRTWPTPLGAFTIIEKETDPVWDVPVSIQREMKAEGKPVITRMEASPSNPLGAHWLRLSLPGIGIHGTNAPSSIYRFASHGCIRMHPDHIAAVFARVTEGMTGVLIYHPVVVAVIDGRVWLEANPDAYQRAPNAAEFVRDAVARYGVAERVDWNAVSAALRLRRGRPVDVTRTE